MYVHRLRHIYTYIPGVRVCVCVCSGYIVQMGVSGNLCYGILVLLWSLGVAFFGDPPDVWRGFFKGDIDIDIDVEAEVDIDSNFGCFKAFQSQFRYC